MTSACHRPTWARKQLRKVITIYMSLSGWVLSVYEYLIRGRQFQCSVRFLRRPVGPRPATLLSGLQLQKRVGPAGRQLLYLLYWAASSTTVKGYWYNKILFKRYTFSCDPNQPWPGMCTPITRDVKIVSTIPIREIKVLPWLFCWSVTALEWLNLDGSHGCFPIHSYNNKDSRK